MKRSHIIALLFIVVAIGAIVSTVYNAGTYSSFAEARQHPGREVHIIGELIREQPIEEALVEQTLVLRFFMRDSHGEESQVIYFGAKPQDFEKSDQVVLIGRYQEEGFIVSSLLLKCPSKYNPEDLQPEEFDTQTYSYFTRSE
jgi:cytochrome c-type biogenesis protein CcmE